MIKWAVFWASVTPTGIIWSCFDQLGIKVTLMSLDVNGDKTNEPGCLKAHLHELFPHYSMLQLLTGDAIFAQRPLLEVLKEHGCDYLFQIKGNQPDILDEVNTCFAEIDPDKPDATTVEKRGKCRSQKNLVQH